MRHGRLAGSAQADIALLRSLHRAVRALRAPRSQLWHGIFSGVVRRTQRSQAYATLQAQACTVRLTDEFRTGGSAAIALPSLGVLSHDTVPRRHGAAGATDTAFAALRHLHLLDAALAALEADGAFEPMRRQTCVRFVVGQLVNHQKLGPCVVYGWDPECAAEDPPTAAALDRAGGATGIIDNRKAFVGIDAEGVCRQQPFYRVQTREGRGHYCAQELLRAVPRAEALCIPIQGSSFFFTGVHKESGCLVPRAELAARYPEDVELARHGLVHDGGAAAQDDRRLSRQLDLS